MPCAIPKVKKPAVPYEVIWVDAIHDNTHDGDASEAGGIETVPCLGYHVRNGKNEHGKFVVMAMQARWNAKENYQESRFELSIPVSMIRTMTPVILEKGKDDKHNADHSGI